MKKNTLLSEDYIFETDDLNETLNNNNTEQ